MSKSVVVLSNMVLNFVGVYISVRVVNVKGYVLVKVFLSSLGEPLRLDVGVGYPQS